MPGWRCAAARRSLVGRWSLHTPNDPRGRLRYASPSVDANLPCPAGCPCDLLRLVHGAHRLGGSLVMILLSCRGWPPAAIAELLGCDPATVRRWIHRYNQHGVTGLADRPSWPSAAGQPPARRAHPSAGPARRLDIARLWQRLGRPAMSSPTLYRRVRAVACWRRPRLVAKGDPDREGVLGNLNQAIGELPAGAVVLAEDETHVNLLPWVRATWIAHGTRQQVMTPGTNRRRTIFGAVGGLGGRFLYQIASKGAQRRLHRVPGAASGRLPSGTRGGGGLRQRDHPPRQARPALAGDPSQGGGCCTGPATAPRQPGRADLGRAQGLAGQQPDVHDPRAPPPGARLLPSAQPRPVAGHRRPLQLTMATRGLHTELPGGRFRRARERAGSIPNGVGCARAEDPTPVADVVDTAVSPAVKAAWRQAVARGDTG
jgi:hypothetical protein